MAYAPGVSTSFVFGATGGTSSAIDTTGATGIFAAIWYLTSAGQNFSDSKGNIWIPLTTQTNIGISCVILYCANPIVGTGHTFSTTSHFVGGGVLAVTGNGTSPFGAESGSNANASGNLQPGSLTPSVNNCILITAFGSFNGTAPTTPSGYTSIANNTTATAEAGGMAYKIQTTASAENPTWNSTGSSQSAVLAYFTPAPAANNTDGQFFVFFG